MGAPKKPTAESLHEHLDELSYQVTQNKATEPANSGKYLHNKDDGTYRCVCCEAELFSSDTKYDSGSGWPSFWLPLAGDAVTVERDTSHGMIRDEVLCANCGAHLGHVFNDGPPETGLRYCINSCSLDFDRNE